MKLINPKVEIIAENNPFKKIELAGRTCYKSEDKITDNSAVRFYDALVKRGHTAMLEHATFLFWVPKDIYRKAEKCKYLNTTEDIAFEDCTPFYLVSGNLRAINESGIQELIYCLYCEEKRLGYNIDMDAVDKKSMLYIRLINFEDIPKFADRKATPEEIAAHKYTTMRFTCDRGVSHELVRHRPFSFAQESTRYVNYSKEEFGGGDIKFIRPAGYENWHKNVRNAFEDTLRECETKYNELTRPGLSGKAPLTPQQARALLPNALKTEIVVTGNDAEWQHFFNLRSRGLTGAPHPDMKVVADMALCLYEKQE